MSTIQKSLKLRIDVVEDIVFGYNLYRLIVSVEKISGAKTEKLLKLKECPKNPGTYGWVDLEDAEYGYRS